MAARNQHDTPESPSVEDLSQQIKDLKADVAKLVETLGSMAKAEGEDLTEDMRARAEKLRKAGAARTAEAEARLSELASEAEVLARERPAAAMGVAAGVGFVLGLILARR
jgi:ElaB/YqjD/DUF883 family membrane-anchored ribosome-binding protein